MRDRIRDQTFTSLYVCPNILTLTGGPCSGKSTTTARLQVFIWIFFNVFWSLADDFILQCASFKSVSSRAWIRVFIVNAATFNDFGKPNWRYSFQQFVIKRFISFVWDHLYFRRFYTRFTLCLLHDPLVTLPWQLINGGWINSCRNRYCKSMVAIQLSSYNLFIALKFRSCSPVKATWKILRIIYLPILRHISARHVRNVSRGQYGELREVCGPKYCDHMRSRHHGWLCIPGQGKMNHCHKYRWL